MASNKYIIHAVPTTTENVMELLEERRDGVQIAKIYTEEEFIRRERRKVRKKSNRKRREIKKKGKENN